MEATVDDNCNDIIRDSPPASRVSTACARCRRQKLKCDASKPCIMCIRSGAECQPRLVPVKRRRSKNSDHMTATKRQLPERSHAQNPDQSRLTPAPLLENSPTLAARTSGGSTELRQFGANRSTMSLAMDMYESLGTRGPRSSTIPGDASRPITPTAPMWTLHSMSLPDPSIIKFLIDVYFERLHWFIWILHKPSFLQQAHTILKATSWRRQDRGKVVQILMVAALGLKCALQDTSEEGQQLLASISPDPNTMVTRMIGEVRLHLLDLLDDNCIETVQVCVSLGAYYIFHDSPSLAWATIGLACRTSYALALHCGTETGDEVADQVRRRCWNHLIVADTFASQIYGRPASLDAASCGLLPLKELDDTIIDISQEPRIQSRVGDEVSALTFHWLKYRLYDIARTTLCKFHLLRLHSPMTVEELQQLINAVKEIDVQLAQWRKSLPPLLDSEDMSENFPADKTLRPDVNEETSRSRELRKMKLQACLLQITHDAAIILVHRPLLEYRISPAYQQNVLRGFSESVSRSFDICVKAALRISRIPIMEFKKEFCLAFVFVHLFTAGVILCIPPTSHPHSETAHEARAGVFRIIEGAKALRQHNQIARHTERLLSELLKLSLHREVELSFRHDHSVRFGNETRQKHLDSSNERRDNRPNPTYTRPAPAQSMGLDHDANESETQSSATLCGATHPECSDIEANDFNESWTGTNSIFENLPNTNGFEIEPLDLSLDEAFGQFGQVMFNIMPDDPLSNWGWGKGNI